MNKAVVNKYISDFFITHNIDLDSDLMEEWKTQSNQKRLKRTLQKASMIPRIKRGKSVYICFCSEERPKIFAANPSMNIRDVTCELGRHWRLFKENPDSDRLARLEKLSAESNAKYYSLKKMCEGSVTPKRIVRSAYLDFCKEMRLNESSITLKELGVLWAKAKEAKEAKEAKTFSNVMYSDNTLEPIMTKM